MDNWKKYRCDWNFRAATLDEIITMLVKHSFWTGVFITVLIAAWNFWFSLVLLFGLWVSMSCVSCAVDELKGRHDHPPEEADIAP